MKAPDESGINKDFIEKSTDWIATDGKAPMMRTFLIRKIIRLGGFCHAILQSVTTHSWFLARSNDELLMACERRVQQALFRLWSPRYRECYKEVLSGNHLCHIARSPNILKRREYRGEKTPTKHPHA